MITIFNRRELISTFDSPKQAAIRDLLAGNKIDYKLKVISRTSTSAYSPGYKNQMQSYGKNVNYDTEFTFYVKKSDYSRASYFLAKNRIY